MTETAAIRGRNDVILGCCLAVGMLLLVSVAMIDPRDVTKYRFLRDYVVVMSAAVPGIERLAAVSSFPEVTKLVVSLMWTLVPIFAVVYFLKIRMPESFFTRYRERPFFMAFGNIVVAIVIVLFAVLFDIEPEDLKGGLMNETVLRAVSTSRVGLGLISGFFSAGIAMMVYMLLLWFFSVPRIYFSKR